MPRPRGKRNVKSLPEYLEEVLRIAHEFDDAVESGEGDGPWFRGASDRCHGLLPGAYWRKSVDENALIVDFMAQAPPYFKGRASDMALPEGTWDWYFLMQHYGLPTRLLDWTESALTGLYFALQVPGPRPCVWVLDPAQLNKRTINDANVISPGGEFSRHWMPVASDDQEFGCRTGNASTFGYQGQQRSNEKPMAIFAARMNSRILAQLGTFTVHGANNISLEKLVGIGRSPLACIDIAQRARETLLEELEICGITDLRLFPELERLAPYIKRRFDIG